MIFPHLANRGSRVLRAMSTWVAVAMFLLAAAGGGHALTGVDERGPLRAQFFAETSAVPPGPRGVPPPSFEGKVVRRLPDGTLEALPPRVPAPPGPFPPLAAPTVGNDVFLADGGENSHAIAVNDGNSLIAVQNQGFTTTPSLHNSTDGNGTWTARTFPPVAPPYTGKLFDPWANAGNNADEFFATLIRKDPASDNAHVVIARSTDGGVTWPLFFERTKDVFQDREMVDIDRTDALGGGPWWPLDPADGKVYLAYDDRGVGGVGYVGSFLQVVSAAGTALTELTISTAASNNGSHLEPVAGVIDGQVYLMGVSQTSGGATTILDFHEVTWAGAVTTLNKSTFFFDTTGQQLGTSERYGVNGHRINSQMDMDIDRTSGTRRGDLYVISNRNPNPGDATLDQGDVYLSVSMDGALSWTSTLLPGLATGKTQFFSMIDVDDNGWLHVGYYQNETGSVDNGVLNASTANVYYTLSRDGGATWEPHMQVNDAANALDYEDPPLDHSADSFYLIGDYTQIKATGSGPHTKAYVYWTGYDKDRDDVTSGNKKERTFMTTVIAQGGGGVITEIIDATGDGGGNILTFPDAIAVDGVENVYVAGQISDNAFKITPGGVITEIIDTTGDGGGNTLDGPRGIAVDGAGNVYVAGAGSDNAFKITTPGTCSTGGTPCTITEIINATGDGGGNILTSTQGIAVDGAGNVYVSARNTANAFKITPGGVITEIIDATGDGGGNILDNARGIAVDGSGNVYVTGNSSDNAFKITTPGTCSTGGAPCTITEIIDATGDGGGNILEGPILIAVDGAENVYVVGGDSDGWGNAFKITPGGVITEIIDRTGDGGGNLASPFAIAVDGAQNVYVTGAWSSDNAFKIATPGTCSTGGTPCTITEIIDASGDDGGNILDRPLGIAVDGAQNVYVIGGVSNNAFKIGAPVPPAPSLTFGGTVTHAGTPLSVPGPLISGVQTNGFGTSDPIIFGQDYTGTGLKDLPSAPTLPLSYAGTLLDFGLGQSTANVAARWTSNLSNNFALLVSGPIALSQRDDFPPGSNNGPADLLLTLHVPFTSDQSATWTFIANFDVTSATKSVLEANDFVEVEMCVYENVGDMLLTAGSAECAGKSGAYTSLTSVGSATPLPHSVRASEPFSATGGVSYILIATWELSVKNQSGPVDLNLSSFEFGIGDPKCGNGFLGKGEECDDGGTSSLDGCSATCESEDIWGFGGTAVGGFTVDFSVDGVALQITTVAGQTAADIAQAVATAINSDLTLQGLGVNAFSSGSEVATDGNLTNLVLNDPGLTQTPPLEVPALSPPGLIAVLALLCGISFLRWRCRRPQERA